MKVFFRTITLFISALLFLQCANVVLPQIQEGQELIEFRWNTKPVYGILEEDTIFLQSKLPPNLTELRYYKQHVKNKPKANTYTRNQVVTLDQGFLYASGRYLPIKQKEDTLATQLFLPRNTFCKAAERKPHSDSLLLINNLWGRNKVNYKKDTLSLCMATNGDYFGWMYDMPQKEYGIVGFPSVVHRNVPNGKEPGVLSTKSIAELRKLKVQFDVELIQDHGRYNLAYDLWIVDYADAVNRRKVEIMIWEDRHKRSKPNGKKIDVLKTTHGTYDVYLGKVVRKKLNRRWAYVALVNQNPRHKGTTDLDQVLSYLLYKNILNTNYYIGNIEFGTELVNADGYALIKDFRVQLE